jgi:hypothetical protein
VAQFEILALHLPLGPKETTRDLSQGIRFADRGINPGPPEYAVLANGPQDSQRTPCDLDE